MTFKKLNLMTMVDFALMLTNIFMDFEDKYELIRGYAIFLRLELELGMFFPCDKDGNFLVNPDMYYDEEDEDSQHITDAIAESRGREAYKEAEERVWFTHTMDLAMVNGMIEGGANIERLAGTKVELTQTAIKEVTKWQKK